MDDGRAKPEMQRAFGSRGTPNAMKEKRKDGMQMTEEEGMKNEKEGDVKKGLGAESERDEG